jgi:hypothetical protein
MSAGALTDGKSAASAALESIKLALPVLASARANTVWRNDDFNTDTPKNLNFLSNSGSSQRIGDKRRQDGIAGAVVFLQQSLLQRREPVEAEFLDKSSSKSLGIRVSSIGKAPVMLARGLIQVYRLSLSGLIGRQCRYLPTCSAYMDEAMARHGLWCGGWLGLSRLCRCHPWADSGYDPVPVLLPAAADALHPWRYGAWRRKPVCEAVDKP